MLAFEGAGQCQDLGLSLPFAYAVPRMELRQLRYFVAVAEEGNISRAARKIFLTQPALSRQIKSLEDEIGQCLLERSAHSIRLSPAGEALLCLAAGYQAAKNHDPALMGFMDAARLTAGKLA
jgi:hypothetical protein